MAINCLVLNIKISFKFFFRTTQWSNEKVQKDNQRSTKHTYKIKNRVARTPLNPG